jgi:hypothetical protein
MFKLSGSLTLSIVDYLWLPVCLVMPHLFRAACVPCLLRTRTFTHCVSPHTGLWLVLFPSSQAFLLMAYGSWRGACLPFLLMAYGSWERGLSTFRS